MTEYDPNQLRSRFTKSRILYDQAIQQRDGKLAHQALEQAIEAADLFLQRGATVIGMDTALNHLEDKVKRNQGAEAVPYQIKELQRRASAIKYDNSRDLIQRDPKDMDTKQLWNHYNHIHTSEVHLANCGDEYLKAAGIHAFSELSTQAKRVIIEIDTRLETEKDSEIIESLSDLRTRFEKKNETYMQHMGAKISFER